MPEKLNMNYCIYWDENKPWSQRSVTILEIQKGIRTAQKTLIIFTKKTQLLLFKTRSSTVPSSQHYFIPYTPHHKKNWKSLNFLGMVFFQFYQNKLFFGIFNVIYYTVMNMIHTQLYTRKTNLNKILSSVDTQKQLKAWKTDNSLITDNYCQSNHGRSPTNRAFTRLVLACDLPWWPILYRSHLNHARSE